MTQYKPMKLTPEEFEQACMVAGKDPLTVWKAATALFLLPFEPVIGGGC